MNRDELLHYFLVALAIAGGLVVGYYLFLGLVILVRRIGAAIGRAVRRTR